MTHTSVGPLKTSVMGMYSLDDYNVSDPSGISKCSSGEQGLTILLE